jgi:undecaprenyl diphosphate synthase
MQSTSFPGLHLGLILDGNGRWAQRRGLPRTAGHAAGADAVRRVVEAAPGLGIGTLTMYAFSSDNWKRPPAEVGALMALFSKYLQTENARCRKNGVRVSVIGRRDRLAPALRALIEKVEQSTSRCEHLHLRLAVDYSSRDAILDALRRAPQDKPLDRDSFASLLSDPPAPDVDLLIRTAGEQRLSDFMLWECAYAEFWFTQAMWPDFGAEDLRAALAEYQRRERRYGGLIPAA